MSMSMRLPITVFRKLIFQNSCKVISSTPVRLEREDVLDELDENERSALDSKKAKIVNVNVNSMRLDLILKAGLGISRNKIETAFYESKVRRNGQKVLKKSVMVCIGDEIDLVNTDKPPQNPKFVNVSRIKILDAELEDNKYSVQLMRDKNLIVEAETEK